MPGEKSVSYATEGVQRSWQQRSSRKENAKASENTAAAGRRGACQGNRAVPLAHDRDVVNKTDNKDSGNGGENSDVEIINNHGSANGCNSNNSTTDDPKELEEVAAGVADTTDGTTHRYDEQGVATKEDELSKIAGAAMRKARQILAQNGNMPIYRVAIAT